MNILTSYQAKEIAQTKLEERRRANYDLFVQLYKKHKTFKNHVDAAFDGIRANSEIGEFVCFVDIRYRKYADDQYFYDNLAKLLVDAFSHLGYSVGYNTTKESLHLWIEWL